MVANLSLVFVSITLHLNTWQLKCHCSLLVLLYTYIGGSGTLTGLNKSYFTPKFLAAELPFVFVSITLQLNWWQLNCLGLC